LTDPAAEAVSKLGAIEGRLDAIDAKLESKAAASS
jgi:hypothetical protein